MIHMLILLQLYLIPFVVGILILALVLFLFRKFFLRRLLPGHEYTEKRMRQVDEEAEKLLLQARKDALGIVAGAEKKASELLTSAKSVISISQSTLKNALEEYFVQEFKTLNQLSEEVKRAHGLALEASEEAYRRSMENVAEEVANESRQGIITFLQFLKEKRDREENIMKTRLEEWSLSAKKEIEKHQKETMRKIEESVFSIIYFVSKEVLGKALSAREHQELILNALGEAKKEEFFNEL